MKKWIALALLLVGLLMLKKMQGSPVYFEDDWMDSPKTHDTASLVSQLPPDTGKPVFIACHGYTATTYEWQEFRTYAELRGALVSLVLLGGHGRDLETFRNSTWQDWGKPIVDEYNALSQKGYTDIHLIAASASCPLILNALAQGQFSNVKSITFIDPFLIPVDKKIYLTPFVGFFIKNSAVYEGRNKATLQHWYNNRPIETLQQLVSLIKTAKKNLKNIKLETTLFIYQSSKDPVSSPDGAKLIGKYLPAKIEFVDSSHHVFIQGQTRQGVDWSEKDAALQHQVFDDILKRTRQQ